MSENTPTLKHASLEEVLQAREKALAQLEQENMELKLRVYTLREEIAETARVACDAEKRVARECTTNKTLRAALAERDARECSMNKTLRAALAVHKQREHALTGGIRALEEDMRDADVRASNLMARFRNK